jgi:hypothetical protein
MCFVSATPQPLYPQGKSPWYSLDRRPGGLQSLSGRGGEEKYTQPLPELEPPIIQPVAQRYTIVLSRLHQTGMFHDICNDDKPNVHYVTTDWFSTTDKM